MIKKTANEPKPSVKLDFSELPRIVCVGGESITTSHGTGMMFSRHFSRYPKSKVIDVHFQNLGGRPFFKQVKIPYHLCRYGKWTEPWMQEANSCLKGEKTAVGQSLIYEDRYFDKMDINWRKFGGLPDLIYSTCYSFIDFAFLHHFYRHLPKKVPIIQHFLDLNLGSLENMVALFKELQPAFVDYWALTVPIQVETERHLGIKTELVQALQQPLDTPYKIFHRPLGNDFRAVIIGNIWSGSAFKTLCNLWSECKKSMWNLPPLHWHGHVRRFDVFEELKVEYNPTAISDILHDGGYLDENELRDKLISADMAIVAFSGVKDDQHQYTTFSLPSRIGEYCALGLPIVVISRPGTEPWRIVTEYQLGLSIDPTNLNLGVTNLIDFISNDKLRNLCGKNARSYAEKNLNLEKYQKEFYPRLVQNARKSVPKQFLKGFT